MKCILDARTIGMLQLMHMYKWKTALTLLSQLVCYTPSFLSSLSCSTKACYKSPKVDIEGESGGVESRQNRKGHNQDDGRHWPQKGFSVLQEGQCRIAQEGEVVIVGKGHCIEQVGQHSTEEAVP
jgi:hypothetical protein